MRRPPNWLLVLLALVYAGVRALRVWAQDRALDREIEARLRSAGAWERRRRGA